MIALILISCGTAAMLLAEQLVKAHDRGIDRVRGKSTSPDDLEESHAWLFVEGASA